MRRAGTCCLSRATWEAGSRVAWPDAPDGIGYVHVTMGKHRSGVAGRLRGNGDRSTRFQLEVLVRTRNTQNVVDLLIHPEELISAASR